MRKKILKLLILAFSAILVASCATITSDGKYQEITIESNVPGALVELDGVELGYTPLKRIIKKENAGRIKVSKPGYSAGEIEVRKKRNYETLVSGNLALGFGFGGVPYSLAGLYENNVAYPKRKREYEERKSRGETEFSEEIPQNNAPAYIFTGFIGTAEMSSFFASTDLSTGASWEYRPSSFYVQLKEIEQSNSDYSNELSIRYFATMNHSQIAIDAGSNGEYSEALANIMETKMDSEAARQGINEALEKSKGDQVMFGDALMERFRRQ